MSERHGFESLYKQQSLRDDSRSILQTVAIDEHSSRSRGIDELQPRLQHDRSTTMVLNYQSNKRWRHNRPISKLHVLPHDWCVCITSMRRRTMIWAWHVASGYTPTWGSRTMLIGCGSFRRANQWLVISLELTPNLLMSTSCNTLDSDSAIL